MSAIAGILGELDETNHAALARMSAAMAHRGPDGQGTWSSPAGADGRGCLLAHRRLAVIDRSDASHQPMEHPPTRRAMSADATIYNYRALRDELAGRGERFDSTGDAEVALRVLALGGPPSVSRLRGAFAIAVWDDAARQLWLARDPLGHKPLYVARNPDPAGPWSLAFASEVRALLASGLLGKPKLNPVAVASMVWNGFVMSPDTMVAGVESLLPGQVKVLDAGGAERAGEFAWRMPPGDEPKDEHQGPMREALRESVRLHLASDVPVGVFLSGGIDSSAIANLAQQHGDAPVRTFCLAMEDPSLSEGDAARAIARAIGSEHHEVLMTEQRFVAALDAAIDSLDQPTFDALNQYHICRAVREAGVGVALGGVAGDAIFGGDATLRRLPQMRRLASAGAWVPESVRVAAARLVASVAQKSSGPIGAQTKWAKLPSVARAGGDLLALYQLTYAMFLPEFQRELLSDATATAAAGAGVRYGLPRATHAWLSRECDGHTPIEVAAILETRCFVGERLLRDADTVSATLGLELRAPLADPVLIEHLNRLPDARKYLPVGRKPLLRKYGLEGLDPALFDRPKSGFVLPFDRWLRANLGSAMDGVMKDTQLAAGAGLRGEAVARLWQAFQENAPGLYWTRVWAIYVLIRWCHRHGVVV
jgi:asparagine synthase (glutamine-hydrolysing)